MKIKIIASCLLAASLAVTTSCSDYLSENPKGRLTRSNYFKTQADLDGAVNKLYERINQTQSWTNPMYPQWQGDDMTANPGSNKQAVADLDVFASDGANKGVTDAWNLHYSVIKAANFILSGADDVPVSQTEVNIAKGQAHFWRAYAYFYMVRLFGPLPLITSDDLTDEVTTVSLSSVQEVYSQIVSDLQAAEIELPTSFSAAPRHHDGVDAWATKQAAQATLAAVYMAMAGYPLNLGTEYYRLAAAKAKEVIDANGTYGFYLDGDWSHVYSIGHNYNKETVLGIDNNGNNGSWDHDSELTSCCRFEGLGDGGWGDVWGEIAFWKRYPEGTRKNMVYAPKVTFQNGTTITRVVDWWALDENGNHVVEAYHPMFSIYTTNCDPSSSTTELKQPYNYLEPNYTGMTNGHRHRVIRYAEVLLWYAESAARSGGDLNVAKNCLRQVRQRACDDPENVELFDDNNNSLGKVAIADMNADQLASACYLEHGWEVAGNWVSMVTRRSDEFRMNVLKVNFDFRVANNPQVVAHDATHGDYIATESVPVPAGKTTWNGEETIYLPYPTTEVEQNPNLHR